MALPGSEAAMKESEGLGREAGGGVEDGEGNPEHYADWVPVTEVCDDDYRSFCWPCRPLDESEQSGDACEGG